MNLKECAKRIKKDLPALFLALRRRETPLMARIMAAITVGYALSPIDLIPDFIPVLGYLDDLILLPILVALTIKLIPKEIWLKCRGEAEKMWQEGKPKKWYYALPIIVIWGMIIYWILQLIMRK